MAYIEFKNVKKIYKMGDVKIRALNGVDFKIDKGEFAVVLGPSGAGKSTILNILGGMDTCTTGEITVDGKRIDKYSSRQLTAYRRYDIGFVFQFYNLVQNLTVKENVELATQICKKPLDIVKTIEAVGLSDRIGNFPSQLSGGEQQRVALARALVNNPSMLIADEPTGNLDPDTAWEIMNLLNDINLRGTTIVVATHAKDIVDKMKKRVIQIEKGNIIRDDKKGGYNSEI
jgi:putative ABC transport system ATP-binding protein